MHSNYPAKDFLFFFHDRRSAAKQKTLTTRHQIALLIGLLVMTISVWATVVILWSMEITH